MFWGKSFGPQYIKTKIIYSSYINKLSYYTILYMIKIVSCDAFHHLGHILNWREIGHDFSLLVVTSVMRWLNRSPIHQNKVYLVLVDKINNLIESFLVYIEFWSMVHYWHYGPNLIYVVKLAISLIWPYLVFWDDFIVPKPIKTILV